MLSKIAVASQAIFGAKKKKKKRNINELHAFPKDKFVKVQKNRAQSRPFFTNFPNRFGSDSNNYLLTIS